MNQARKRARMAQKFEETKTTISNEKGSDLNENFTEATTIESNDRDRQENFKNKPQETPNNALLVADNDEIGGRANDDNRNGIGKGERVEVVDGFEGKSNKDTTIIDKISNAPSAASLEGRIKKFLKSKTSSSLATVSSDNASSQPETSQTENGKNGGGKSSDDFEDECTEHLYPNEVDISNVSGEIIQVRPCLQILKMWKKYKRILFFQ